MTKLSRQITTLILSFSLLSACQVLGQGSEVPPLPDSNISSEEPAAIGLANPASVYCEEMGYALEMQETEEGTVGVCVFPDGEECEEWGFLAGRCGTDYSYCAQNGYTIQSRENSNIATCQFPDGSSCPEFEYFSGECQP